MDGFVESNHLEGEGLSTKVGLVPKSDGQVNLPEGFGLLPWHDTVEGHPGRSDT
jgi:hypothetical protein